MNNEKNDVSNYGENTTKYYIITNNLDSNEFIREISKIPTTYFCTNPFGIRKILSENASLKEENKNLIMNFHKTDLAKHFNISRPYLDKLLKNMNKEEVYDFLTLRNKIKEE